MTPIHRSRYEYRKSPPGDIAPPHGVWDLAENQWRFGVYSTKEHAEFAVARANEVDRLATARMLRNASDFQLLRELGERLKGTP